MTASKTTYLHARTLEALGIEHYELDVKDLPLNDLMFTYEARRHNEEPPKGAYAGIAREYTNRLLVGKLVLFRDPNDNRWYYVKAHRHGLVVVFHPLGLAYNRYMVLASHAELLAALHLANPQFTDNDTVDRIFGFESKVKTNPVVVAKIETVEKPIVERHWDWHAPAIVVKEKDNEPTAQELRDVQDANARRDERLRRESRGDIVSTHMVVDRQTQNDAEEPRAVGSRLSVQGAAVHQAMHHEPIRRDHTHVDADRASRQAARQGNRQ